MHSVEKANVTTSIQQSGFLRFETPEAVAHRALFLQRQRLDQLNPVGRELLQSVMGADGTIGPTALNDLRKVMFYRGCTDDVRLFMWTLCLGYYNETTTQAERLALDTQREAEYERVKSTWQNVLPEMKANWAEFQKTEEQIRKDVDRTDREDAAFWADPRNAETLSNVLMSAFMYNVDLGYGQGMNDIAVVVMRLTQNEAQAFWLFQAIMAQLEGFYSSKPNVITDLLNRIDIIVSSVAPALSEYLRRRGINYLFFYKNIVLLYKRFFETRDILRFWDVCSV